MLGVTHAVSLNVYNFYCTFLIDLSICLHTRPINSNLAQTDPYHSQLRQSGFGALIPSGLKICGLCIMLTSIGSSGGWTGCDR